MTESGLISNIVSLASASAKTATSLFNIAEFLRPNSHDVISIASSISALSLSLTHLCHTLRKKHVATSEREELAAAILQLSRTLVTESEDLAENLELLVRDEKCNEEDTGLRLGWMFKKSKSATLKQSLEGLKITLCLLIVAMSLASALEIGPQDATIDCLRVQMECIWAEISANIPQNTEPPEYTAKETQDTAAPETNSLAAITLLQTRVLKYADSVRNLSPSNTATRPESQKPLPITPQSSSTPDPSLSKQLDRHRLLLQIKEEQAAKALNIRHRHHWMTISQMKERAAAELEIERERAEAQAKIVAEKARLGREIESWAESERQTWVERGREKELAYREKVGCERAGWEEVGEKDGEHGGKIGQFFGGGKKKA